MSQYKHNGFPEVRPANPVRKEQLEQNKRVRSTRIQNLEFMGPMMTIPPLDWAILKVRFPDLIAPDAQIQKQAWDIFMKHPDSEPYRVKDRIWLPSPTTVN